MERAADVPALAPADFWDPLHCQLLVDCVSGESRNADPTASSRIHTQTSAVGTRGAQVLVPAPSGPKRPAPWRTPEGVGPRRARQGRGAFRGVAGAGRRPLPRGTRVPGHGSRSLPGSRRRPGTAAGTPWAPRRTQRSRGHGNPGAHRPVPAPPPRLPLSRRRSPASRLLIVQRRDWLALFNFQTPPWSWGRRGGICALGKVRHNNPATLEMLFNPAGLQAWQGSPISQTVKSRAHSSGSREALYPQTDRFLSSTWLYPLGRGGQASRVSDPCWSRQKRQGIPF